MQNARYNRVAGTLHWILAVLVLAQLYIGWTFADLPRGTPAKGDWFMWHKTVGILILLLTVGRIGWRVANPPPPFPATMPGWERAAARVSHLLFYAILLILPLSGWVLISSGKTDVTTTTLVGGMSWPLIPGVPEAAHEPAEVVHGVLILAMVVLFVIHAAAALRNQYFGDRTLSGRMPPFRPRND